MAFGGVSNPDPFVLNDDAIASTPTYGSSPRYRQTAGLTMRAAGYNPAQKTLCLIAAGQSNYTGIIPTIYQPSSSSVIDQMNLCDGGSYNYSASAPALGTQTYSGFGGNVIPRIAQNAVTAAFDKVVTVNCAIGGTLVEDWATGVLSNCIPVAIKRLISRGYVPGATGLTFAVTWGQGETQTGTALNYTSNFATMVSNAAAAGFTGSSCRWFVNVETWLAGSTNATIAGAQASLPNGTNIFAGGNLDSLNATNRQADNTHFNDTGAAAAATLVWNAMHASGAPY